MDDIDKIELKFEVGDSLTNEEFDKLWNYRVNIVEERVNRLDKFLNNCWLCGSEEDITEHHIKPIKLYGKNDCKIILCKNCHTILENFKKIIEVLKKEKGLSINKFKKMCKDIEYF